MCDECRFSPATTKVLEKEAGFRCGFPACRTRTVGPSNSSASGLSQVGEAAHITAASSGGKRFDKRMSHATRSGAPNGIWMCQRHAKLIDTDELRFPTHLLRRWKRQLRHLAQWALDRGLDFVPQMELIRLQRRKALAPGLTDANLAEFVEHFFQDIGARFVWRAIAEGARQTLTELLFNDWHHGSASWARLESHGFAVRLVTDGQPFSIQQLEKATSPSGGRLTVEIFTREYSDTHVLSYDGSSPQRQRYLVTDIRRFPVAHNPCSAHVDQLRSTDTRQLEIRFTRCAEVHLYMSSSWTISASKRDLSRLDRLPAGTSVVLHTRPGPMSEALVATNNHLRMRIAKP